MRYPEFVTKSKSFLAAWAQSAHAFVDVGVNGDWATAADANQGDAGAGAATGGGGGGGGGGCGCERTKKARKARAKVGPRSIGRWGMPARTYAAFVNDQLLPVLFERSNTELRANAIADKLGLVGAERRAFVQEHLHHAGRAINDKKICPRTAQRYLNMLC